MDIVEGHLNEIIGKHKDLSERRLSICLECPIMKETAVGPLCDSDKWIDKDNNSSEEYFQGATKGCGCRLSAKTALKSSRCIVGKW